MATPLARAAGAVRGERFAVNHARAPARFGNSFGIPPSPPPFWPKIYPAPTPSPAALCPPLLELTPHSEAHFLGSSPDLLGQDELHQADGLGVFVRLGPSSPVGPRKRLRT